MPSKMFFKQLLLLLVLMTIFGLWSLHLGQDVYWDLKNYHFYDGYAFLHHRMDMDIAPAMIQSYFNPFLDVINYVLIVTQKPIVVGFLLGAISGITAFFMIKIGLRIFENRWLSFFAMFIGMTGYAGIVQLGMTTNETKTACLLTIAIYCLLKALASPTKYFYWIICGGLLVGMTVGLKLTAVPMALGIIVGFVFIRPVTILILGFSTLIGFLITDGYWMWVIYHHFHNPVFPYFNNIFHSPYGENIDYKDTRYLPPNLLYYLLLPFYYLKSTHLSGEYNLRDPRLAITFVLLLLFLCTRGYVFLSKKKILPIPTAIKFLITTFIVAYVSWLHEFGIYRYAVLLEIIGGLLIVYMVSYFIQHRHIKIIVVMILAIAIQADTLYVKWDRIHFQPHYFMSTPFPDVVPHSLLILPATEPLAYMAPFIDPTVRILGIKNGMMDTQNQNQWQIEENALINHFPGTLYSLTTVKHNQESIQSLSFYNLVQNKDQCVVIHTVDDALLLCPLIRVF